MDIPDGFSPAFKEAGPSAYREAVINAILHGNKNNPSRNVDIRLDLLEAGGIQVKIRDQGEGFDPESIRDPLENDNLLSESGRGILIMRALMDRVEIKPSERGTKICLYKMITPEN